MISNITIILFYLLLVVLLAMGIFKLHSRNSDKILIPFDDALFKKITMPIIELYINGIPLYFVVDSGAVYSTLNKSELEHLEYEDLKENDGGTYGIDGNIIPVSSATLNLHYGKNCFKQSFQLVDLSGAFTNMEMEYGVKIVGLLGDDFLLKYGTTIDFNKLIISMKK